MAFTPSRSPLPKKRSSPADTPKQSNSTTKKTKAELKRESLERAREWAEERKRKKEETKAASAGIGPDSEEEEVAKKAKTHIDDNEEALDGSENVQNAEKVSDVLHDIPPDAGKTRKSPRLSADSVASEDSESLMSESSTRSGRRRSVDPSNNATKSSKKRGRPKKSSDASSPMRSLLNTPTIEEDEPSENLDDVSLEKAKPANDTVKDEDPKIYLEEIKEELENQDESVACKEEEEGIKQSSEMQEKRGSSAYILSHSSIEAEENDTSTPAIQKNGTRSTRSVLPALSVFFHAIILQWTLSFAVILTFFLDWFVFEFGGMEQQTNQRLSCTMLGLWLVTISGQSIAFGARSRAGWILTTASLAVASFAVKLDLWKSESGTALPIPSTPIYSISTFEVNVPDLLVVMGLIGCVVCLFQPIADMPAVERPHNVDEGDNQGVPSQEAMSQFQETTQAGIVDASTEETKPKAVEEVKSFALEEVESVATDEVASVATDEVESVVMEEVGSVALKEVKSEAMEETIPKKGPRSLIGHRVAVDKNGGTLYGSVYDYDAETRCWIIHYDSTDEEDELNRINLASAFKLYAKESADYLKEMWRSGEI